MADSSVSLSSPTGSVDTRTNAAGEHREVVVIGDSGDNVASETPAGTKTALDVNIAASTGGVAATTGTLANVLNSAVTASVALMGNATITVLGGTYTGLPIIFEATIDGTNWFTIDGTQADGTGTNTQVTLPSATGGPHQWNVICPGYQSIRVRVTGTAASFTTGPTVTITQGPFLFEPSPTVAPIDGQKATFSLDINAAGAASVASATADVWALSNPAASTRTIRVIRLSLQVSLATAAAGLVKLVRRSSLNSGGSIAVSTPVKHDTADPATPVITGGVYTAAATTPGTLVGDLRATRLQLPVAPGTPIEWTFGNRPGKGILLRPGESLGVLVHNATGGAPATAPTVTGDVEWTEE